MNFKILSSLVLGIFLLSGISAVSVYSDFSDSTQIKTINTGQSVSFNVDFFSMNPPITSMKVGLYSGDNLIQSFLDSNTNSKTYSNTYTYTANTAGTFEIRITGTDKLIIGYDTNGKPIYSTDSEYLTLVVNSVSPQPPVNHAPVITSTAITNVNEGATYNYDVSATDSDGNTLTYSLTQSPSWLSINSATGLISGVAPLVSSDSDYDITVEVSDGTDTDTQSYTLTVSNVLPSSDITPPEITVVSPEDREYDTHTITLRVLTDEPADVTFRLDEGTLIEMNNPSDNLFTYTLTVDNDGDHIITFYAEDNSGNTAREYARFSIEIHESHGGDDGGATTITTPDDFYYQNKYYDQFNSDKVAYTNKTTKTYNISILVFFYFLITIISLGIIIVVFLLGRNLRRWN